MATKLESVCTNPPVPTADQTVARCALCAKPLSNQTIYRDGGAAFCSKEAADQHRLSNERMEALNPKKSGVVGLIIKLLIVAGLAAGAWFGYQYWKNNKEAVDKSLTEKLKAGQQSLNDISNKTENAIKEKSGQ